MFWRNEKGPVQFSPPEEFYAKLVGSGTMIENNVQSAADFSFAPYVPNVGGDSETLRLATLKTNPQVQYVVKGGSPEIACNEFMYHHVVSAFGLYAQEARLFKDVSACKYAVGIRYVPDAKEFVYDEADEVSRRDFYAFQVLYVILNEEDSQEFYCDEQGHIFKLDNAASFNLQPYVVQSAIAAGQKKTLGIIRKMLINGLNLTEYAKYGIVLGILNRDFGQSAADTGYDTFRRFAAFDETQLNGAYEALNRVYPSIISDYYRDFIRSRKKECERFVEEYSSTHKRKDEVF
jgi:hypothetical protein